MKIDFRFLVAGNTAGSIFSPETELKKQTFTLSKKRARERDIKQESERVRERKMKKVTGVSFNKENL